MYRQGQGWGQEHQERRGRGARKARQARAALQQEVLLILAGLFQERRGGQERRQRGHQRRQIPVHVKVEALPAPSFLRDQRTAR
jgi:hypothetical protein